MTTEAAEVSGRTLADDTRAHFEATLEELEKRPVSWFRSVTVPAAAVERRAEALGFQDLAVRAKLLRADVLVREGRLERGGRWAHQVLAWAQQHDHPFLLARAHRILSSFYRQIGDLSEGLTHAVQCYSHLTDDEPQNIRARHLMALGIALDESGSTAEGGRRFREALHIATTVGDLELTMNILNNMAYTAFENDDEAAARDLVRHMREAQARSPRNFSAHELDTIARVEMMGGRYDAAEETLSGLLEGGGSKVESHEGDAPAVGLLTLAEARRLNRRYAAAQQALDEAVRIAEERGLDRVRAQAREEQAALYAATGRFRDAYDEHLAFHKSATALHSAQREARARALQAVFEATEARRASEHFREMAHRDALTGLYNRRYVNERLPALLGEALVGRRPISVAILDLDYFKRVNDTLSHGTGDVVLQEIARLLLEAATGPTIAARMGGEEFLLIMPDVEADEAADRCERLRLRIRAHAWEPITGAMPVTTSIGVTTSDDGRGSPSSLLSLADRNLYVAKREGRDRVVADV
ncbi:GGDEF domain-containing protein [Couchioplanes caeruleus]|uniref:Diguanylate cyclase (GGDEF)-like protein n=1 Tax=Couchioplanes caeruleus TaxID=56438 RepID=A0A3N1GS19_9ACTN|nr:GGDEF domain-containing protein [Couchioplanes caeruleus]ROP33053.1 diguanylate cyclase (GGDEF)-like protein [Couchioplanes caeruleus]